MPVRFDEEFLIWVAAKQPLKNTTFLSNRILDLCGELPIFWLQSIYPKGSSYFFQILLTVVGGLKQDLICGRFLLTVMNEGNSKLKSHVQFPKTLNLFIDQ